MSLSEIRFLATVTQEQLERFSFFLFISLAFSPVFSLTRQLPRISIVFPFFHKCVEFCIQNRSPSNTVSFLKTQFLSFSDLNFSHASLTYVFVILNKISWILLSLFS